MQRQELINKCIDSYERLKNLKLVGKETGIPWQTVYVYLKSANIPVVGDKLRYGSDSDKLAAKGEMIFNEIVPIAENLNFKKNQSKIDFNVLGYSVDVKTSEKRLSNKKSKTKRWAFSLKKQELIADFFVCLSLVNGELLQVHLIPNEIVRYYSTISVSENGSKWDDYLIEPSGLLDFFKSLPSKETIQ